MSTQRPTARELADAMIRADYRRQLHRGQWRVAWWGALNRYPQLMPNAIADRRAMLRTATGIKRPPYSAVLWQELFMMLPAVPTCLEFEAACVKTAAESHARYDNPNLTGGPS